MMHPLFIQIWQDSWPWNYLTESLNSDKMQIQETMENHNYATGCLDNIAQDDVDDDDDDCDVTFTLVAGCPGYNMDSSTGYHYTGR